MRVNYIVLIGLTNNNNNDCSILLPHGHKVNDDRIYYNIIITYMSIVHYRYVMYQPAIIENIINRINSSTNIMYTQIHKW